jgi:molybdenum cofactor biosynthesis protein MoaC
MRLGPCPLPLTAPPLPFLPCVASLTAMKDKPTHLDETGAAHMVDVGAKPATERRAIAEGRIRMAAAALAAIRAGNMPKGDVLSAARIAGIMAAKRTADLIPLCHPLALTKVTVDFAWEDGGILVRASAATTGPTGVEMEALTAASVALLTLYDMAKALDRAMVLEGIRLLEKSGGRSGDWRAE